MGDGIARIEQIAQTALDGKPGRRKRTAPLADAPPPGAPITALLAWLTAALGLGRDPLAQVQRFGRHDEARMVLTLCSGQRIVYERQADVFSPDGLARRIVLATGIELAPRTKPETVKIAAALVRAAGEVAEADDRVEARDWAATFFADATELASDDWDAGTAAGRYAAMSALLRHRPAVDGYATAAQKAVVIRWTDGSRWVRTGAFGAHVRAATGRPLPWGALVARMEEVGWRHLGDQWQREPRGDRKLKVPGVLWIPAGWDE